MPSFKRIKKNLLLVTCLLSLVTLLSGCNAIGSTKPAALQITTTPETSVFLDGKHLGKTPFRSDQLKAKEYLLKLASGEASYVQKISLTAGTLTVIDRDLNSNFLAQAGEVLSLIPGKKGIFVISMPAEADLTIDGRYIGKTPNLIDQIADGDHKLLLSKTSYVDREISVKTSGGYQLSAEVTLASQIAKGISPSPAPTPAPQKVEIQNTPLGFLRVRQDPSLNSQEIGRVKEGDQVEFAQETQDWTQINFAGKQGWVSSQYIKKLTP